MDNMGARSQPVLGLGHSGGWGDGEVCQLTRESRGRTQRGGLLGEDFFQVKCFPRLRYPWMGVLMR